MYYNEILSTNCKNDNNIRLAMKVLDFFLMLAQLKKASDVSNFPILLSFSTSRYVTFLEQDFCGFFFFGRSSFSRVSSTGSQASSPLSSYHFSFLLSISSFLFLHLHISGFLSVLYDKEGHSHKCWNTGRSFSNSSNPSHLAGALRWHVLLPLYQKGSWSNALLG